MISGDSGYSNKDWLIIPLANNPEDPVEQAFNRAIKETRRPIENAYGILKEKFPCLNYLRVQPLRASIIITACATLHNIMKRDEYYVFDRNTLLDDQFLRDEPALEPQARIELLLNHFR